MTVTPSPDASPRSATPPTPTTVTTITTERRATERRATERRATEHGGAEEDGALPGNGAHGGAFRDPGWWLTLLHNAFGRGFWGFLALALGSAGACYTLLGRDVFLAALDAQAAALGSIAPRIVVALLVAGLLWVMLPRQRVAQLVGRDAGMRGLLIALAAGTLTPGGPTSAFALLAVLAGAGASRGVLITYITAWALLGVQRMVVWDVPLMGFDFSATRFLVSLPLPVLAGLIAMRLPVELRVGGAAPGKGER